jgi:hypothetical protein
VSGPTVRELAARVAELENRLDAVLAVAGIFYDAGYADASSPVPLAEAVRKTREDVLAKGRRRQMRRVK